MRLELWEQIFFQLAQEIPDQNVRARRVIEMEPVVDYAIYEAFQEGIRWAKGDRSEAVPVPTAVPIAAIDRERFSEMGRKGNAVRAAQRAANGQRGSMLLEAALVFPVFLFLILGALDVIWIEVQKSSVNYLAQNAATCAAKVGCDPTGYSMSSARGLNLQPANLTISVDANKNVTVTYAYSSLTGFLPSGQLSASASAN